MKFVGILVCLLVAAAVLDATVIKKDPAPGLKVAEQASKNAAKPVAPAKKPVAPDASKKPAAASPVKKSAVASPAVKPSASAAAKKPAVPAAANKPGVVPAGVPKAHVKRDVGEKLNKVKTEMNKLKKNGTASHGHGKHLGHKFAHGKDKPKNSTAAPKKN